MELLSRRSAMAGLAAASCAAILVSAIPALAYVDPAVLWEQEDKFWREYPKRRAAMYRGYIDSGYGGDRAWELTDINIPLRYDPRTTEQRIHPNRRMYGYWLPKGKRPSRAFAAKYARCHDKTLVDALAKANIEAGGGMRFVTTATKLIGG